MKVHGLLPSDRRVPQGLFSPGLAKCRRRVEGMYKNASELAGLCKQVTCILELVNMLRRAYFTRMNQIR